MFRSEEFIGDDEYIGFYGDYDDVLVHLVQIQEKFELTNKLVLYSSKSSGKLQLVFSHIVSSECYSTRFINFESEILIRYFFRNIFARELGVLDWHSIEYEQSLKEIQKLVKLVNLVGPFYLVFDNVRDYKLIKPYIDLLDRPKLRFIVITNDRTVVDSKTPDYEIINLDDSNLFYSRYKIEDRIFNGIVDKHDETDDYLLLKWLISFNHDYISLNLFLSLISDDNVNFEWPSTLSENNIIKLDFDYSYLLSFQYKIETAIDTLRKKQLILKFVINKEIYLKICSPAEIWNFFNNKSKDSSDIEQIKIIILFLLRNYFQRERELFYKQKTPEIKPVYTTTWLILSFYEKSNKHESNFQFQKMIMDLYYELFLLNLKILNDKHIQFQHIQKCYDIIKKFDSDFKFKYPNKIGAILKFHAVLCKQFKNDLKSAEIAFNDSLDFQLTTFFLTDQLPELWTTYYNMGVYYIENNDFLKAHYYFNNSLTLSLRAPDRVELLQSISSYYEPKYAIELLDLAYKLAKKQLPDQYNHMLMGINIRKAINLTLLSNYDEAIELFKSCINSLGHNYGEINENADDCSKSASDKLSETLNFKEICYIIVKDSMGIDFKLVDYYTVAPKIVIDNLLNSVDGNNENDNLDDIDTSNNKEIVTTNEDEKQLLNLICDGNEYLKNNENTSALNCYIKSLDKSYEINNKRLKAYMFAKIAEFFDEIDDYNASLEYSIEGSKLLDKLKETNLTVRLHYQTAVAYFQLQQFDKCISYIEKIEDLFKNKDSEQFKFIWSSMERLRGQSRLYQKEYEEAIVHLQKSIDGLKKTQNDRSQFCIYLNLLGLKKAFNGLKNIEKVEMYERKIKIMEDENPNFIKDVEILKSKSIPKDVELSDIRDCDSEFEIYRNINPNIQPGDQSLIYSMNDKGYCLIINNNIENNDVNLIEKLFKNELKFKVENLDSKNILDKIKQFKKSFEKQQNDNNFSCLFVILMLKGNLTDIIDADGGSIKINQILKEFKDCLDGKPKVFIIQTYDESKTEDENNEEFFLSMGDDYFVWQASINQYLKDNTSPFIKILIAVLCKRAYLDHLLALQMKTNELIMCSEYKNYFNIIPCISSSATKLFYFNLKN